MFGYEDGFDPDYYNSPEFQAELAAQMAANGGSNAQVAGLSAAVDTGAVNAGAGNTGAADVDALRALGMSDADIASLTGFNLSDYQSSFMGEDPYANAVAKGLTEAQATGLSDRYVTTAPGEGADIVSGTNARILSNLGLVPDTYAATPVFKLTGDQGYENYDFAPLPGQTYRLVDNNTGNVIGTATNATEAKALVEKANAISEQMGGNANWALQQQGSFSDGKGNMTTGFSDVYTNEKTGVMNDLSGVIQAAGVMAAVGGGIAALSTSAAGGAGAGAAGAAAAPGGAGAVAAEAGSLAPGALASTAANVAAVNTAAAATAASAGLTSASASLLAEVGMEALRGGMFAAAMGEDLEGIAKAAVTGGFAGLASSALGPVIQSVDDAGKIATNLGSSIGTAVGTTVGGIATGNSVKDSFISGVMSGGAEYISSELFGGAEDQAKQFTEDEAKEIRNKIFDDINSAFDLESTGGIGSVSNTIRSAALDEIIVNAGRSYGPAFAEFAKSTVADSIAGLARAEAERKADNDAKKSAISDKANEISKNFSGTGGSAASAAAAQKAVDDLIIEAQGLLGPEGAEFAKNLGRSIIDGLLVNAPNTANQVTGISDPEAINNAGTVLSGLGGLTVSPTPTITNTTTGTGTTVSPTPTFTNTTTGTGTTVSPTPTFTNTTTGTGTTVSPTPTFTNTTTGTGTTVSPTPTFTNTTTGTGTTASPTPTFTNTTTGTGTKWTTEDWIMLGLAAPNLINRIVGKGADVGTITDDKSAITYNQLNRQRGIGSFDPFTYGQEGPGYQTAEYEFFRPYSAAQPAQTSSPVTVNWTPGADIYQYTPSEFSALQSENATKYAANQASFKNYQDTLAQNVESGTMTLAEAQALAQSYATPFGGATVQQNAEGGYIGYAEGGEMHDDMVKHLLEYKKGGGHNGPGPVKGIGSGQEDKIPAWLSDGEYVWSAQDVADLGDGSTDEGVRRLDKMRQMVRKQAGRKDVKKIAKPQRGIDQMLKSVGGKV